MARLDETQVSSPCVDNCCLDDNDICIGCRRSLQEILNWGEADSAKRLEILKQVEQRKGYK